MDVCYNAYEDVSKMEAGFHGDVMYFQAYMAIYLDCLMHFYINCLPVLVIHIHI